MKIGHQVNAGTAISAASADTIIVRGHDLCADLVGKISFTEHFFLLVVGKMPSEAQARILNATLVAIAEHGLVPSVQTSRMTYAAAPEAFQGAVAAGILGSGSVILGSSEAAGRFLAEVVKTAGGNAGSLEQAARTLVAQFRSQRRAIPGYGHPLHKTRDPRVARLLEVADEAGTNGIHAAAALAVERILPDAIGKPLMMNVSGAIPSVLLDAGFPIEGLKGVPILARAASLIAHLVEEQKRPIGFALSDHAAEGIGYDGPAPPGFTPT